MRHPATPAKSMLWHGVLAGYLLMGVWFHTVSTWRHFQDWRRGNVV